MKLSKEKYNLSNFTGDIMGGITAAVASLPLALAFGVGSGLGAQAGLYGAIGLGLFAAIFGGTKGLISAPTAPMTAVSTVIIGQLVAQFGNIEDAFGSIMLAFMVAGVSQIVFGMLRIGRFVHFIPYPVVSGFMTGVGALIILSQVGAILGIPNNVGKVDLIAMIWQKENILSFAQISEHINITAIGVAFATLFLIVVLGRITKKVPPSLIALLVMTAICYYAGVDIPIIGIIPSQLPTPTFPDINMTVLPIVLIGGVQLGGLGVLDTLLTSVIADSLTHTKHRPNKELIGQGIGQIISGIFGGIPGAGTTTCTVINIKAGGYSWVAGVANAVFLLMVLLVLNELAALVPLAVLAGILLKVGTDIIDYQGFKYMKAAPKTDSIIIFLVLIITIMDDLIDAVAVGMIVALIMFMKKMSDVVKERSYALSLEDYLKYNNMFDYLEVFQMQKPDALKQITVKNVEGPLFFGHVPSFQERLSSLQDLETLILNMEHVPYMDEGGIHALKESSADLKNRGIRVILVGVQPIPMQMLIKSGICSRFPAQEQEAVFDQQEDTYEDLATALDKILGKSDVLQKQA